MIPIIILSIIGIILVFVCTKQMDDYIELTYKYEDLARERDELKSKLANLEIRHESLMNFRNLHAETEWVNTEGEVIYADLS